MKFKSELAQSAYNELIAAGERESRAVLESLGRQSFMELFQARLHVALYRVNINALAINTGASLDSQIRSDIADIGKAVGESSN